MVVSWTGASSGSDTFYGESRYSSSGAPSSSAVSVVFSGSSSRATSLSLAPSYRDFSAGFAGTAVAVLDNFGVGRGVWVKGTTGTRGLSNVYFTGAFNVVSPGIDAGDIVVAIRARMWSSPRGSAAVAITERSVVVFTVLLPVGVTLGWSSWLSGALVTIQYRDRPTFFFQFLEQARFTTRGTISITRGGTLTPVDGTVVATGCVLIVIDASCIILIVSFTSGLFWGVLGDGGSSGLAIFIARGTWVTTVLARFAWGVIGELIYIGVGQVIRSTNWGGLAVALRVDLWGLSSLRGALGFTRAIGGECSQVL